MTTNQKSKLFISFFAITAFILGWGIWTNYRPQVILASCADIADKSSTMQQRYSLEGEDYDFLYNEALQSCLSDAGVNK